MGAGDSAARPTSDVDPTHADGNMRWYGIGGVCSTWAITDPAGRAVVVSRQPAAGLVDDVCKLVLDKRVAEERQLQVAAAAGAGAGAAGAGGAPKSPFDLGGEVRRPDAVEMGVLDAPDGGRWAGAGTQVIIKGLKKGA